MTWGFVSCGPNQVMVVSGCCHSRPLLVPGGRVFIWPLINKIQYMSLNITPIDLESSQVMSHDSTSVTVKSTAQVKIINSKVELRKACNLFLDMDIDAMTTFLRDTIEGHQRSVIGKLTVEQIYFEREVFIEKLTDLVTSDLADMGITLMSVNINEVIDEAGIIESLLRKKSAENQANLRKVEAETALESVCQQVTIGKEVELSKASLASNALSMMADLRLTQLSNEIEISKALANVNHVSELTAVKNSQVMKENELMIRELEVNAALLTAETNVKLVQLDLLKDMINSRANLQATQITSQSDKVYRMTRDTADAHVIRLHGLTDAHSVLLGERNSNAQQPATSTSSHRTPLPLSTSAASALSSETNSLYQQDILPDDSPLQRPVSQADDELSSFRRASSRSSFTSSIIFTLDKLASSFLMPGLEDNMSMRALSPAYTSTPSSPYTSSEKRKKITRSKSSNLHDRKSPNLRGITPSPGLVKEDDVDVPVETADTSVDAASDDTLSSEDASITITDATSDDVTEDAKPAVMRKVSQVIGINLTNAILVTVVQEVMDMLN